MKSKSSSELHLLGWNPPYSHPIHREWWKGNGTLCVIQPGKLILCIYLLIRKNKARYNFFVLLAYMVTHVFSLAFPWLHVLFLSKPPWLVSKMRNGTRVMKLGFPKDIHHVPRLFMSTTAFLSPHSVFCVFQSEFLMTEVELMRKLL